jgi:hypothetical protein
VGTDCWFTAPSGRSGGWAQYLPEWVDRILDAFSVCEGRVTYEYELLYWATSLTKLCASGWENGERGVGTR